MIILHTHTVLCLDLLTSLFIADLQYLMEYSKPAISSKHQAEYTDYETTWLFPVVNTQAGAPPILFFQTTSYLVWELVDSHLTHL